MQSHTGPVDTLPEWDRRRKRRLNASTGVTPMQVFHKAAKFGAQDTPVHNF